MIAEPTHDPACAQNVEATFAKLMSELGDKGKKAVNNRAGALSAMRMMLSKCVDVASPYVAANLGAIIEASADKMKPVSIEADLTAKALVSSLSSHGLQGVLPAILAEGENKWQANLLRCELLQALAKASNRQMQRALNGTVPVLSGLMWDTKAQVKTAATSAIGDGASPPSPCPVHFASSVAVCRLSRGPYSLR